MARGILLLALCAFVLIQCVNSHKHHDREQHHHSRRQAEVKRATYNVTLDGSDSTETTADILTRLKLLAYAEKLKAKQAKQQAKADKKAQKEAAWNAYLTSLIPPTPAPGTAGAAGAAAPAPAPVVPAMGLWKKSFIMSQLAAMAQANAAAAAAAAATTPVPAPVDNSVTTEVPEADDSEFQEEE